jgi:hypothetical protein
MARTRKKGLGASLVSAFDLMPENEIVRAARDEDDCKDSIPILVKPDRGAPILLVPGDDRKVRAYDIKPKRGVRIPKPPFDTKQLIGNTKFKLTVIESRIVKVGSKTLRINGGFLENALVSLAVVAMRWGEIHPPRPRRR